MSEIDTSSQEFKDAVAAAVTEATEGLKAKNTELLGKLQKAKSGQQIDPSDYAALEAERDALQGKLADANKALGKATKDVEAANKRAATAEGATSQLLVDNGLNEALAKAGVTNPVHIKAAKAMLGSQVQIVADGENRVAKVGDKALSDFITEWAGSDEGKHFVAPSSTAGDGAQSAHRVSTSQKSVTRAAFDAMSPDARMAHSKSGGTVTDA